MSKPKSTNWIFNVGLGTIDHEKKQRLADMIREAIMAFDFVTDVMDWEE